MPRGDSSLYFFYETLYERKKKTKNPPKKITKIQDPKILLFMPRGNSILILTALLYTFFLYALKVQIFFSSIVLTCMCTMSANLEYICWPVGARVENYILITECMSFTNN